MRLRSVLGCFLLACAWILPAWAQQQFESADAAAQALIDAAGSNDAARCAAIIGPQGHALMTSGNADQDRAEQTEFARLSSAKHQLEADPRDPNRVILSVGDDDWPFPVPIVRANGKWNFDPSQARVEMEARRIGVDELDAIEICAGYVQAQRQYAAEDRDKTGMLTYASHMFSAQGRHDGLYWEDSNGSLVPRGFAEAVSAGDKTPARPYHGYYFRVLDGQGTNAHGGAHDYRVKGKLIGGFGLVAWPARYGVTGFNTYIVNQDGIVYQKDIPSAPGRGPALVTRFDPDPSWSPVE